MAQRTIMVVPQPSYMARNLTVPSGNGEETVLEAAFMINYKVVEVVGRTHKQLGACRIALNSGVVYVESYTDVFFKGIPNGFAIDVLHTPNYNYVIQRTKTASKDGYKVAFDWIDGKGLTLVFS